MFLTNHAHVLVSVAESPDIRVEDIAQRVGITNRQALSILRDLEEAGYLLRHRVGRRTHYTIEPDLPLRHPALEEHAVGELLNLLVADEQEAAG